MTTEQKVIPIASDHAGFPLKQYLIENLRAMNFDIIDYGTHSEARADYPDFVHQVASDVNSGDFEKGIVLCGSGQGANMTANKYPNVRSALCWNSEQAKLSRLHNNANVIALPGRFIAFEEAIEAVKMFLSTPFEGGRHVARVEKIPKIID
jgi:ribose 5-phosphate isomerase B